jgi:arylsulfatase
MTKTITDFAVETVKHHAETQGYKPFFLYLAYTAPHWPLHAPRSAIAEYSDRFDENPNNAVTHRLSQLSLLGLVPTSDNKSIDSELVSTDPTLMAVYAAQMTEADRGIASIRALLDELALSDNTLIAVFSDNGASAEDVSGRKLHNSDVMLGDKGSYLSYGASWASVSNTPFRGHKGSTYEGGIRSPLVLYWPNGTTTPPRFDKTSIISVADLYPTLLSIAGVETPPDSSGEDVSKIFDGETRERIAPLFWEHLGWRAARDGDWKGVYDPVSRRWQLFNLTLDPGERMDISSDHPEVTSRLAEAWEQWSKQVGTDGFDMKVWQSYYQPN